jgi:hypothetical protein
MSAPRLRGINQELRMTCLVKRDEPECRFVNGLAHGKEAMVLENCGFTVGAEGCRDALGEISERRD